MDVSIASADGNADDGKVMMKFRFWWSVSSAGCDGDDCVLLVSVALASVLLICALPLASCDTIDA